MNVFKNIAEKSFVITLIDLDRDVSSKSDEVVRWQWIHQYKAPDREACSSVRKLKLGDCFLAQTVPGFKYKIFCPIQPDVTISNLVIYVLWWMSRTKSIFISWTGKQESLMMSLHHLCSLIAFYSVSLSSLCLSWKFLRDWFEEWILLDFVLCCWSFSLYCMHQEALMCLCCRNLGI